MDDEKHSREMDARRRRLDALFADEPFLSPTMKARRLHEKIEHEKLERAAGQEPDAFPKDAGTVGPEAGWTEISSSEAQATSLDTMTFTSALACLRTRCGAAEGGRAHQERLRRFRDEILRKWLEYAPTRDADS